MPLRLELRLCFRPPKDCEPYTARLRLFCFPPTGKCDLLCFRSLIALFATNRLFVR